MNDSKSANFEKVAGLGRIDARLSLRHNNDGLVFAKGINEMNGTLSAYRERQNCMWKQDRVPHRQYRQ